ncbi:MAG: hypothetical protein IRY90_12955 [Actinomadura rubrobrunea]|nr:hypothetical protein [Actinomadura rubrobrunea]
MFLAAFLFVFVTTGVGNGSPGRGCSRRQPQAALVGRDVLARRHPQTRPGQHGQSVRRPPHGAERQPVERAPGVWWSGVDVADR